MKQILLVLELAFCLLAVMTFGSCSTTEWAKIDADGVYFVSPYGILGAGSLRYQRAAQPAEGKAKKQEEPGPGLNGTEL